jgi:hypothetical protein
VQDIASQFPPTLRDRYVTAAKSFRIPYWDWAARIGSAASAFPTSISSPQVTVTWTDGKSRVINNPLYTFQFHPLNPSGDDFDERVSFYLAEQLAMGLKTSCFCVLGGLRLTLVVVEPIPGDDPLAKQ